MTAPTRRAAAVALAVTLAFGAVACGDDGADQPSGGPTTTAARVAVTVAATTAITLDEPIALVVRPGDDDLWVAERAGRIRRLSVHDDGRRLVADGDPVLDLTDQTTTDAERGLLGVAFSADGGTLYVSHTNVDGDSRVASYRVSGTTVDADSRRELLAVKQPFPNHNGGHLVLHDGRLWLGLGDGGAGDDPENRAQDDDTLLGKLLTIDPATGRTTVVAKGLRNPWRFAFDTDGSIWIADVGQNEWEEIDHVTAADLDGANFGWSGYEGTHPHLDGDGRRPADAVPPVYEYAHGTGGCSITGGFAYRGTALPALTGTFLFSDYCNGRLLTARLDRTGTTATAEDLDLTVAQPVSFAAGPDGEPYVLSASGTIVRLHPAP